MSATDSSATSLLDQPASTAPASTLRSIQRRMAAAVMEPLTRSETTVRRRRDGVDVAREAAAFVKPNDRLTSFERLEIYNRQYWFRLYASFEEDFPGLAAIVGRQKFEGLMRQYIAECPSTSFTLRNLGSKLSEWLIAHPEWIGGTESPLSILALDMVRIEWAHIEAFDEAAEPAPTADDFAAVTDETRFRLQPHLKLLQLHFPVDDLLIAVRNETGSGDATSNNAKVSRRSKVIRRITKMEPEEIFLAIHRHDNSVYYKRLHPEDYRMLELIGGGATLAEAITGGFEGSIIPDDDRPAFLQQAFQTWAELGWFVK